MNFKDLPIGIDLGTTNSCIGVFRNGSVEIIPNEMSGRTMPSVVSFYDKFISIGDQTKNKINNDPSKFIYSIKRIIGKKFNEENLKDLINNLTYKDKIIPDEENRIFLKIKRNNKVNNYSPQEISSLILKRLKENAMNYLDLEEHEIKKAVITIPAYFNETQREATKAAAEAAGFEVLKIINEPTAAALAYGLKEKNDLLKSEEDPDFFLPNKNEDEKEKVEKKNILVFDLGGGTLDVTCLKYFNDEDGPEFRLKGHSGNTLLGGDDFDNKLIEHCINKFEKENNIKINRDSKDGKEALKRLKIVCEETKKILSTEKNHRIIIQSLYKNDDLNLKIDRVTFNHLCREYFEKIKEPIYEALKSSGFKKEDINEILLVGGSTRIPKIKEIISDYFGEKIKINDSINPDEVVAYGATLQAAICMKEKSLKEVIIYEVLSHSIGTDIIENDVNEEPIVDILIKKGNVIPFKKGKVYSTVSDYQTSVSIQVYEGENKFCKDNTCLGGFYLNNIHKDKKGDTKIRMTIEIDQNSIIHVSAEEEVSGEKNSIDIKYKKGILRKEELKEVEKRLKNKDDYEITVYNEEEKELIKDKILLGKIFLDEKSLVSLMEMKNIQEKLVEISLNESNKNNFDKKFRNIKFLFKYYNFLFKKQYEKENEEEGEKDEYYVSKIKKYLDIFKNDQPFYIKTLIFIFKDNNLEKRVVEIIKYSIELIEKYINNISEIKKKKFIIYYYDDILDIINNFNEQINSSSYKEYFETIKSKCKTSKEKKKQIQNWDKKVSLGNAIFEIDHLNNTIENFKYSQSKTSKMYEKSFRAYHLTRLSYLDLRYFSNCDLKTLEEYMNEAQSLVEECNLNDDWIKYLEKNKEIIEKKKKEEKIENSIRIKNYQDKIKEIKNKEINGEDDEENIKFFEFIFANEIEKKEEVNVKDLYASNKHKLTKIAKMIVDKLNTQTDSGENSWIQNAYNAIYQTFENKNLIN